MYTETNWKSGDIITAEKLLNINSGINEAGIHPLDRMKTGTAESIDSYTTAGLYWLNKSVVTNTPNGGSGMLIVTTTSTGNAIYQIFVTFNTGNGYVAIR